MVDDDKLPMDRGLVIDRVAEECRSLGSVSIRIVCERVKRNVTTLLHKEELDVVSLDHAFALRVASMKRPGIAETGREKKRQGKVGRSREEVGQTAEAKELLGVSLRHDGRSVPDESGAIRPLEAKHLVAVREPPVLQR